MYFTSETILTITLLLLKLDFGWSRNVCNKETLNKFLVVNTVDGPVEGRESYTENLNKTYHAFQGIPYAQPPIGNLRFKAPLPAKSWDNVLRATRDEKKCIQLLNGGSEDCLYINVFSPNVNNPSLPVMVWIYGGYFLTGDSQIKNFGPDYFIDEDDVIVVTFNYRLGVFGFLSTEDEVSPGNYALKDHILALKWVQSNIANFGGDPKKVTLFGESAGSASVSYLVQSPLTKGLFRNAIMQSGTSLNSWSLQRRPKVAAFAVGKLLGIITTNTQTLLDGLRNVEARKLLTVATSEDLVQTALTNPLDGLVFSPSLEPISDEAVITNKSHLLLQNGQFNHVPCIIGFNSQEGIPFIEILDYVRLYLLSFDIFPTRLVPVDMNIDPKKFVTNNEVAFIIKNKYFGLIPVTITNKKLIQYVSDDQFVRPINEVVKLQSKHSPVYYYRFSYEGKLGDQNRAVSGVGHGEDLNYIWRHQDNLRNPPAADILTRRRLVRLWTNFAKTSNPTPVEDVLLQNVTWPLTNADNLTYLDIGRDLILANSPELESMKFWKDLYEKFGVPPHDTY